MRWACLAAVLSLLACGTNKRAALSDGGEDHGDAATDDASPTCDGAPPACVLGQPWDDGVACSGVAGRAACVDDAWQCPHGTIPQSTCTCSDMGPVPPGTLCTANGWVRSDGGATNDAVAPPDGDVTCPGAQPSCVLGGPLGTGIGCGTLTSPAVCFEGAYWECGNWVLPTDCTCVVPGPDCAGARCTAEGWACPDGGVSDAPDANVETCSFSAIYTFYDDGGLRLYSDSSTLSPPRMHLLTRTPSVGMPIGCVRDVPCASTTAVSVAAVEAAIADVDVQAALAVGGGLLYGTDTRPSDGSVFVFERGDGRSFKVGSGTVPAGLRALSTLLHQLQAETVASTECAVLPH